MVVLPCCPLSHATSPFYTWTCVFQPKSPTKLWCPESLPGFIMQANLIKPVTTLSPHPLPSTEATLAQSSNYLIMWLVSLETSPHPQSTQGPTISHILGHPHPILDGRDQSPDPTLNASFLPIQTQGTALGAECLAPL